MTDQRCETCKWYSMSESIDYPGTQHHYCYWPKHRQTPCVVPNIIETTPDAGKHCPTYEPKHKQQADPRQLDMFSKE